jgi:hypothetical protein
MVRCSWDIGCKGKVAPWRSICLRAGQWGWSVNSGSNSMAGRDWEPKETWLLGWAEWLWICHSHELLEQWHCVALPLRYSGNGKVVCSSGCVRVGFVSVSK